MEVPTLTVVCPEGLPPAHDIFLHDGCRPQPVPARPPFPDVEDSLEMALGGVREVTGAGTGNGFSNLDVEVDSGADRSEVLRRIFAALRGLNLGDSVRVRPGDGDVWLRSGEWF